MLLPKITLEKNSHLIFFVKELWNINVMQRFQQQKFDTLAVCFLLCLMAYFVLLLYYHLQSKPKSSNSIMIYKLHFFVCFLNFHLTEGKL